MISERDYFAGLAMQALRQRYGTDSPEEIGRQAYVDADAMMAARSVESTATGWATTNDDGAIVATANDGTGRGVELLRGTTLNFDLRGHNILPLYVILDLARLAGWKVSR